MINARDPNHIIANAASVPHAQKSDPSGGAQDGPRAYQAPRPDVFIYHLRIADTDETPPINVERVWLYRADQYAVRNGKLTTWASEETSEMSHDEDVDNIWRLGTIAMMRAAMGQGDGWVTGLLPEEDETDIGALLVSV